MLSYNGLKHVIGYSITSFDSFEDMKYLPRGPRTPRKICSHLMGSKWVIRYTTTPFNPFKHKMYVPRGPRSPKKKCSHILGQEGSKHTI